MKMKNKENLSKEQLDFIQSAKTYEKLAGFNGVERDLIATNRNLIESFYE